MKEIILNNGKVALVDDEDFEELNHWKWSFNISGHARRVSGVKPNRTRIYMHRQIMKVSDRAVQIDHIDGNKLNNQKNNLRICRNAENTRNQKKRIKNSSGFKGVYFDKRLAYQIWASEITVDYKKIFLGYFDDARDAARAYDEAAEEHHGKFARTNKTLGLL